MKKQLNIIDCTRVLDNGAPSYPNDTPFELTMHKTYHKDGYTLSSLKSSVHNGTHIDAPSHISASTICASDFDLNKGISRTKVFDCSNQMHIELTKSQLASVRENDIVVLYTGWDQYYSTEKYYTHPVVSISTAQQLVDRKIALIVLDMPSLDFYPFDVHQLLFNHGIWIVENTTNLHQLNKDKEYTMYVIPMKIKAEAASVRVFAIEKSDELRYTK